MPRIYIKQLSIGEAAIDAHRHVNNQEYLRWMEEIAIEHSTAQGWPMERYLKSGASWPSAPTASNTCGLRCLAMRSRPTLGYRGWPAESRRAAPCSCEPLAAARCLCARKLCGPSSILRQGARRRFPTRCVSLSRSSNWRMRRCRRRACAGHANAASAILPAPSPAQCDPFSALRPLRGGSCAPS